MLHARPGRLIPAIVAILLFLSPVAVAFNIETGVGARLNYTDNAALTSTDEMDDWIAEASVGAQISEYTGSFTGTADVLFTHQNYLNDTFDDQDYFRLRAEADWEQIRDRLSWNVHNYYTQTPVNSLDPDTPDNVQDANVFSLGPVIHLQVTPRNSVTINPLFQDYYYEDSDTDNQRYGVATGWRYKMYPAMAVGLNGNITDVSYDDDLNEDYTISNIHAFLSGEGPRSEYIIGMGSTHIDKDRSGNYDGFFGNLDWLINLTGKSSVRACAVTDLTDSSADLFNSEIDPDCGNSSNVQVSGDVLRNNSLRLTYLREGATLNTRIWTEQRDLDYKEVSIDRKIQDYGVRLNYQVSPLLRAGIGAGYTRTRETETRRTDKEYHIDGQVAYQFSPRLRWSLGAGYRDNDSTLSNDEYQEFSVYTGIVFGAGGL